MAWRLARALETLRDQVNQKWPTRSKKSDGSVGDRAHASRSSDHNPWVKDGAMGVVTAIDLTHDPKGGFDSYAFADALLKRQDSRLKYIISNRRIGSGPAGPQAGVWRKYTGVNPHDHHCHISVMAEKGKYDGVREWDISNVPDPAPADVAVYTSPPNTLRKGDVGVQVQTMQGRLNAHGATLKVDGEFGSVTEAALEDFQRKCGLVSDGICGPQSWAALMN
jgi:hypothetical protein